MFVPYWILNKFTESGREPVDLLDIVSPDVMSNDIDNGVLSDQDIFTIRNLNRSLSFFNQYFRSIIEVLDCSCYSSAINSNRLAIQYLTEFFKRLGSTTNECNRDPYKIIPLVGFTGGNRYIVSISNGFEEIFKGDKELLNSLCEDILDNIGKYEGLASQTCNTLFNQYIC